MVTTLMRRLLPSPGTLKALVFWAAPAFLEGLAVSAMGGLLGCGLLQRAGLRG